MRLYILVCGISPALAADSPVANALSASTSNEEAIKRALNEKTSLEFQGVPLNDALEFIADKHHIMIQIDNSAFKAVGMDPTTLPITLSVKDISLRSALNLLLSQYDISSVIKDEMLLFTTKAKADSMFETRLYDVRDLILRDNDANATPDFDSLVAAIRSTVSPQSWDSAGGQGSLATFSDNGILRLVVWQNHDGHDQIEKLLEQLRHLKPQRTVNQ